MAARTDPLLLYRIARFYYLDGRDQDSIASEVGLSRSQISRLLDQARKAGIVRFELRFPAEIEGDKLAESVRSALGLSRVLVSSIEAKQPREESASIEALASYSASVLPGLLSGAAVIGLGWGRTIYSTTLKLGMQEAEEGRKIAPLVGSAGQHAPWLQINGIVDRFAEKFQAERVFIRTHAFHEGEFESRPRVELENIELVSALWEETDAAVFGLGMPAERASYLDAEMDRSTIRRLKEASAVGDILGRFFDASGREIDLGEGWQSFSLPFDRLRKLPRAICLCRGSEKAAGIQAAARAGLVKTLVTDAETAETLLERSDLR